MRNARQTVRHTYHMTTTFAELGLNEQILAGVEALGFSEPTPVQAQAIPLVLAGRDLVASAQTGTGKTCAFTLPALQLIMGTVTGTEVTTEPEGAAAETADDDPQPAKRRRRRRRRKKAATADASTEAAEPAEQPATSPSPAPADDADVPAAGADPDPEPAAGADPDPEPAAGADDQPQPQSEPDSTPAPRRRRRRHHRTNSTPDSALTSTNAAQPTPHTPAGPARPLALVVTPTRELAQQIERVTTTVCAHTGQRCVIVMGGTKFDRQLRDLARGCDLLVATPGRLIDLMEHDHVDLGQVRILVLDEADRMLDMGFWPSVRRIIQALPSERQNLLFSATIPPSIKGTVDAMLTDPASVEIARVGETADTVEEHLCPVTQGQKIALLQALVETGGAEPGATLERVLVFCRTKHRVDDVSQTLKNAGLKVEVMHADRPQRARDKALERFRAGAVQLLVATDVMSRGIDVSGIDAVVNFDVPMDPEDYVHRIGRTGRAGATGHAYTFVAPDEITPLREIEYFTKKLIPVWDLPGFVYDGGRIMPNPGRAAARATRTMFSGSKARRGFGGPRGGRFGRHT